MVYNFIFKLYFMCANMTFRRIRVARLEFRMKWNSKGERTKSIFSSYKGISYVSCAHVFFFRAHHFPIKKHHTHKVKCAEKNENEKYCTNGYCDPYPQQQKGNGTEFVYNSEDCFYVCVCVYDETLDGNVIHRYFEIALNPTASWDTHTKL